MSGHTPGPWLADFDFIYDSNHRRVADAAPWSPRTKERPDETVHANARLIAAAPDLLDLAHKFARECAECGGAGSIETHHTRTLTVSFDRCTVCADICAVIAKATGGPA